jgi:multiple sugar transport system substrate-binding protein
MQGERRLTRREAVLGGSVLGAAVFFGVATAGSPFGGGRQTITFWHLFGGGDGARLAQILADVDKENPDSDVRELILPWGNPYYTKLALAAVGGSPPDVAVMHATRIPGFAPGGLLEELTPELLEKHGLTSDRFLEQPWKSGQSNGRQYAIPLDTHPFVLYYNTELTKKAGLLDGDGKLKPLDGQTALLDAFAAVKKETGKDGVVFETRGVTPWRLFLTLYSQLKGPPIIEQGGSRIAMDDEKAMQALDWMSKIKAHGGGLDVDYQGSVAFFGNQSAGFALNGEWEVTTFQATKLPFDMRTVPTIFDGPSNQADSHTFVIPRNRNRSPERLDASLRFISRMVNKGLDWSKGGHVPAYRKVFESDAYRKLSPQSNYATAADHLAFDPLAWYSGSGSDLEAAAGTAFKSVVTGTGSAKQGLADFRTYLDRLSTTPKPV